ncbi:methylamine utilization protein MauJ [Neptunomonas qingdaonensis]|uniref:Uncharacterized protein n=1 Tax=Neptunomonas qingdaonensis TaxID=1045558 RepID=A0A1I2LWT6_9GAMM|nr:methylamine utilization protein MauJ [Neptunomonas qingdaonensis]SFF83673.1 hypothetical protein SAMN05216175_101293 [Neptunomonas qingdaonensis]
MARNRKSKKGFKRSSSSKPITGKREHTLLKSVSKEEGASTSIQLESLGRPGQLIELHIEALFKSHNKKYIEKQEDINLRSFKIVGFLGKDSGIKGNVSTKLDKNNGCSYMNVSEHHDMIKFSTQMGDVDILKNEKNELIQIIFNCLATSQQEARKIFSNITAPFLDYVSFIGNIPIHINLVSCIDINNNIETISFVSPYKNVLLNIGELSYPIEMHPLYALYRESKNSGSPFYKFLCLYKILEGAYQHLIPAIFKKCKELDINIARYKILVPDIDYQNTVANDLRGESIKTVFDDRFTPEFRNNIAHFLNNDSPLIVSDIITSVGFDTEISLIEECAKEMIRVLNLYYQELPS